MQPSMPRPSTSSFMIFSSSRSSFSHSITQRSAIVAGSIGTRSSSRSRVRTKPPGCWERWRGVPISCRLSSSVSASRGSVLSSPSSCDMPFGDALVRPAPDLTRQGGGHVLRQAERLADLADRAARAVTADHGGERGMLMAVSLVDPLDHLLAPLMLEIDVDVGRLVAVVGEEALEQQFVLHRIDRGDAEHVADHRIGGRTAALAENALAARELHDRMDGEEIGRVTPAGDQLQLMLQQIGMGLAGTPSGNLATIARPGQPLQRVLRRPPGHHDLVRILVAQLAAARRCSARQCPPSPGPRRESA